MFYRTIRGDTDDAEMSEPGIADLHRVYMSSIRQHQHLLNELCSTLSKLGVAIDNSPLNSQERVALSAGIERHVDLARGIIAGIDDVLTYSAPTRPAVAH
ncbi:hypothetical protein [Labrys monachus]|uniref:Uncharacterized protein n=1 Tax=Labrys monachus TaxID=217067 RepID=A0ABU0FC65_9HYPH|nr:hypothetical protein [Labrys monachus]MDQ0391724.1 hypothetical protein [Labrys monachus]